MSDVPLLVQHDPGCKYGRLDEDETARQGKEVFRPGHSDAAKRLSDTYNLHIIAGCPRGFWIACSLHDGSSDGCAYPTRQVAMQYQHHNEKNFAYIQVSTAVPMTVCEAESLLRWQRQTWKVTERFTDRDEPGGGLAVIPRLAREDQEAQLRAIQTGHGYVALGRKE